LEKTIHQWYDYFLENHMIALGARPKKRALSLAVQMIQAEELANVAGMIDTLDTTIGDQ